MVVLFSVPDKATQKYNFLLGTEMLVILVNIAIYQTLTTGPALNSF